MKGAIWVDWDHRHNASTLCLGLNTVHKGFEGSVRDLSPIYRRAISRGSSSHWLIKHSEKLCCEMALIKVYEFLVMHIRHEKACLEQIS